MGSYVNQGKTTKKMISTFGGLDKRERIADGAWSDMINMTAAKYPCAASRNKRARQFFTENVTVDGSTQIRRVSSDYKVIAAECSEGKLRLLEAAFYIGIAGSSCRVRYRTDTGETNNIETTFATGFLKKPILPYGGIVKNGRDIFIYPWAKHTDYTQDTTGKKLYSSALSFNYTSDGYKITVTPTDADGRTVTVTSSDSAPANPSNGQLWYDKTAKGVYKYSSAEGQWVAWSTTYIKVSVALDGFSAPLNAFNGLKEGDAIEIGIGGDSVFTSSCIIHSVSADGSYIIIPGFADGLTNITEVAVYRKAPELQFACSWRNRIWGCCYKDTTDDGFLNEIYGSALGDMDNFYKYEGTAADSYTVSVGTGEEFTGIAQLEDCVIFFKEDRYYILTGSEPPFSLSEYSGAGIQNGSAKSAVVINGYVYYKSYGGIMRMSPDSRPVRVSDALGVDKWEDAIAGTDGEKYYVSMRRVGSEQRDFFIYDTTTGLWTMENAPYIVTPAAILRYRNNAFVIGSLLAQSVLQVGDTTAPKGYTPVIVYLDADNANRLSFDGFADWSADNITNETTVEWHADTGTLGLDVPDNKSIRQIQIRGRLCDGARINIEASYDGHDERDPVYLEEGTVKGTFNAVYTPAVLCDNYKLHFSGIGECVIYSVTVTTEEANDYVQR